MDNPVWESLTGPHRGLARGGDAARGYPSDVSRLAAVPTGAGPAAWADLRDLVPAGEWVILFGALTEGDPVPAGWRLVQHIPGVQYVATDGVVGSVEPEAVTLGADDVPDMLDLVERTRPGPFGPGTHRMGTYRGVRAVDGRLVAMAGERLHPPGEVEISAVCTDPEFRGRGLGTRLIGDLVHGIRARGDIPFLHAGSANVTALRLYAALGFELRRRLLFTVLEPA